MVVFTCQNCNSCLKKKVVETHLLKCKNPFLTCIDCLKDFDSQSYVGHVSCVTENERYGGQGFAPSSSMQKQNHWCKAVQGVLQTNLSPPVLKNIVVFASENPNCPKNKKKFVNFILNNKIFFKAREFAEQAFDKISAEYDKYKLENQGKENGNKVDDSSDKSGMGKRKTISETEVHENENTANSTEKMSKKKNKESNGEVEQTNGFAKKPGNVNQNKNKKKDKRNNLTNGNSEEVLDESREGHGDKVQNGESHSPDSTQSKKKKKKNKDKHLKNSVNQQTLTEENQENEQPTENDRQITTADGDTNGTDLPKDEDLSKLSKKERKKLLKQKKYEAEIVSIENYKKEDQADQVEEEQVDKRKKKKKKHQTEEEEALRQQKNSISEPEDKKIRLEVEDVPEEVAEKPKKFKWDEVILQVLQAQDDGEISLKRLSKKVCAEYGNVYGERESYEEVMLKFNKKVLRTPGVRVLKDRAKLLSDS